MNNTPETACSVYVYCSGPDDPGFADALVDMGRLGYSHVALGPMDPGQIDIKTLKKQLDDAGIAPITMTGLAHDTDISSCDTATQERGRAHLKAAVDLSHELGADQLNGVSYAVFGERTAPFAQDRVEVSAGILGEVADYAGQAGAKMNFEVVNRYESSMINTAAQAVEYVEKAKSDNLGIHLDTFHMGIEEPDMSQAIRTALPYLGYLELGQSGRGSLLTGSVDNLGVLQTARQAGYRGRIGLESFSRQLLNRADANGLAIWRQAYTDSHQVAAQAIAMIRAAQQD